MVKTNYFAEISATTGSIVGSTDESFGLECQLYGRNYFKNEGNDATFWINDHKG